MAAIGPNVRPIRAKPTIRPTMAAPLPGPNMRVQVPPNTPMARVTQIRNRRRPNFSASGPETTVKMPKKTTPMISMVRNSGRAMPRPGTNASAWAAVNALPLAAAAAAACSTVAGAVP